MNKIIKSTLAVAASAAALAGVASIPALVSAGGDSMGGRPSYTVDQINKLYEEGNWNNKVVFNSITDSVIGSEFDFVGAREDTGVNAGKDNVWNGRDIVAEDGKTYLVRMYVHNNGKSQDDWRETGVGVARDTHAFFSIPKGSSTNVEVSGFIDSSNATPNEYWDSVTFKSANGEQFYLEYVPGSALIENNGYAAGGKGAALSDDIVMKKEGTLIGYDGPDGNVPGCYEYANYITIQVKAVYDTDYTIEKSVRFAGTTGKNWTNDLDVKVGDEVEYQIEYTNKSNDVQNHVVIRDVLPSNLEYIPGSTKVWNGNHPNGVTLTTDAIVDGGVDIGSYNAGANAIVRFRAKVVDTDLACGGNMLVNWGRGSIGDKVIQDNANVHLTKVCEPTTPEEPTPTPEQPTPEPETPTTLPQTGPEAVAGAIVGSGTVVTAAGYYVASRRSMKK